MRGEKKVNALPPRVREGYVENLAAVVAGGRKPAQPSIPEGILDFPPPDALLYGTPETKANALKSNGVVCRAREKIPGGQ
jgi:hypothetical protein